MKSVAVIVGSTRPNRIGRQIGDWVMSVLPLVEDIRFDLVDLADRNLPMLDEPRIAALHEYEHEHTKIWSREISGYDGFMFITPQYNWGYSAALKNSLDYLYAEWNGKPGVIVSYGFHGGDKAAAQLRQVLQGLRMQLISIMPAITITKEMLDADGRLLNTSGNFHPYTPSIHSAVEELATFLNSEKSSAS